MSVHPPSVTMEPVSTPWAPSSANVSEASRLALTGIVLVRQHGLCIRFIYLNDLAFSVWFISLTDFPCCIKLLDTVGALMPCLLLHMGLLQDGHNRKTFI